MLAERLISCSPISTVSHSGKISSGVMRLAGRLHRLADAEWRPSRMSVGLL